MEAHAKLYIQNLIKEKKYQLVGSYTLDYEVSRNPFPMRKRAIQHFIRDNMQAYVGEERSETISAMAEQIMKTGIKEKDAYHVASAIYAKCAYFISPDIRLLNTRLTRSEWLRQLILLRKRRENNDSEQYRIDE